MKIRNIEIENFKGIKSLSIGFSDRFNLIIGNNGYGKTSILDAIATALGGFISGVDGVYGRHISKSEVRIETKVLGDASYNIDYKVPVIITTDAELYGDHYTWSRRKSSYKASRSTIEPRNITRRATELMKNDASILPVISYQGAGRMWSERRDTIKNKKNELSRSQGYIDSLWPKANTKNFVSWCAKMEQISWTEERRITEYEVVKKAVANFMSEMNNSTVTKIFYNKIEEELVYVENEQRIPIDLLSSGYQSLIWMAFDIAYRMAVLNPGLRENIIEETTGIVLIDEIDVHLHPQWQWKVIDALMKTFPKVQFIATTHSPVVLASNKNIQLIKIDEDQEISYENSSYGVPIDEVLNVYQEARELPEEIEKLISRIEKSIKNEELDHAEQLLKELESELGSNNPRVVSTGLEIDFEKLELE